jgi:hypothetical protein
VGAHTRERLCVRVSGREEEEEEDVVEEEREPTCE